MKSFPGWGFEEEKMSISDGQWCVFTSFRLNSISFLLISGLNKCPAFKCFLKKKTICYFHLIIYNFLNYIEYLQQQSPLAVPMARWRMCCIVVICPNLNHHPTINQIYHYNKKNKHIRLWFFSKILNENKIYIKR